jgi:hypothetical protein
MYRAHHDDQESLSASYELDRVGNIRLSPVIKLGYPKRFNPLPEIFTSKQISSSGRPKKMLAMLAREQQPIITEKRPTMACNTATMIRGRDAIRYAQVLRERRREGF